MANLDNELREMCLSEAKWLESLFDDTETTDDEDEFDDTETTDDEEKSPFKRLEESVYDLRYTVDANGRYIGVSLLLAGGGPTIHFDSERRAVIGTWGFSEPIEIHVDRETCAEIDEYFEELWNCIR